MATVWTEGLARLYGIVIDDLEKSIRECSDELWEANLWTVRRDDPFAAGPVRRAGSNEEGEHLLQVYSSFWFVAIRTLFFVDLDLGNAQPDFAPHEPFRTEDQEVNVIPRRTYTRDEVLGWVAHVRAKARVTLAALTEEEAERLPVAVTDPLPTYSSAASSTLESTPPS